MQSYRLEDLASEFGRYAQGFEIRQEKSRKEFESNNPGTPIPDDLKLGAFNFSLALAVMAIEIDKFKEFLKDLDYRLTRLEEGK